MHLFYMPLPERILCHALAFAGNALPTWLSDEVLPEGNFSAVRCMAFPGPLIQDGPFVSFKKHLVCTVFWALSPLALDIHHLYCILSLWGRPLYSMVPSPSAPALHHLLCVPGTLMQTSEQDNVQASCTHFTRNGIPFTKSDF